MTQPSSKLEALQTLANQGKWAQARSTCQRLIQSDPANAALQSCMAQILSALDEPAQAIFYADRAAALDPRHAPHRTRQAYLCLRLNKLDDALRHAQAAVNLDPRDRLARATLASIYSTQGRAVQSTLACMIDGAIPIDDPSLVACAAAGLLSAGDAPAAVRLYRDAAALKPHDTSLAGNLCNALNYLDSATDQEIFDAHKHFGTLVANKSPPATCPITNPDPKRTLRLGILSPDLHRHSIAFFLLALFEHLDRSRIELVVYDTAAKGHADAITARLRASSTLWREIGTISWPEFTRTIRADKVDILLELSGHTQWHSLELLPHRPAPIQITYLGYPNTTGLSCVDYRIVDSITDPSPHADAHATERLRRLDPCFLCFSPPIEAPPVATPPSAAGVPITFASFNATQKLNDTTLSLWSRVLDAVPGSRLLVKAMGFKDPDLRDRFSQRLAARGLDASRILLEGPNDAPGDHLSQYHRVDVALDTFPYHGTTTTCESLYMGVPVVTLAGTRHASRVGASLLHAIGLDELITSTPDDFVAKATALAGDPARLASLRADLRPRTLASPLCDAPAFADRFESLLRDLWREACSKAVNPAI